MNAALTVAGKEFRTYFRTPIGIVFLPVFLAIMGWLFFWVGYDPFFKRGVVEMRSFFAYLPFVFLFFIPAASMRMWSEEKKLGTMEVLLTLPVTEWEVVAGKFLAGFGLIALSLVFTLPIPMILFLVGDPDPGPILGGYLGTLFLGAAYLAIGLFASSLTENQIVAFILAVILCCLFLFMGLFSMQGILPVSMERLLDHLSFYSHYESIKRGVLDTRDILYYLSAIFFFLYLNAWIVRRRR